MSVNILESKLNRLKALRVKTIMDILESVNVKDAILAVQMSSEKLESLLNTTDDPLAVIKASEQLRKNSEFLVTIQGGCIPFNALEEQLEKEKNHSWIDEVKFIQEIDFQDIPTESQKL